MWLTDWSKIVDTLNIDGAEKHKVLSALSEFAATVKDLPAIMERCGVDGNIIEDCKPSIALQYQRLDRI